MKRIIILLLGLSLASCSSFLDTENKEELVVEGWIENGHAPVVLVSTTLPVSAEERSLDEIADHILRYAKVTIEHDGETEYLTARMTADHFVQNYFTSSTLRGEVGHSYKLHVEWQDFKADATCTIPEPTPIDTAYFVKTEEPKSYAFNIEFKNKPSEGKYYQTFRKNPSFDETIFTFVPFGTLNGKYLEENLTQTFLNNSNPDSPYFAPNETFSVKLATMEESMYEFWTRYTNVLSTTGSTAISGGTNLKGNVSGAIGYWAGYGVSVVEKTCKAE